MVARWTRSVLFRRYQGNIKLIEPENFTLGEAPRKYFWVDDFGQNFQAVNNPGARPTEIRTAVHPHTLDYGAPPAMIPKWDYVRELANPNWYATRHSRNSPERRYLASHRLFFPKRIHTTCQLYQLWIPVTCAKRRSIHSMRKHRGLNVALDAARLTASTRLARASTTTAARSTTPNASPTQRISDEISDSDEDPRLTIFGLLRQ